MPYYPVTIQRLNTDSEKWEDFLRLHAIRINKAGGGESFAAGAEQFKLRLRFEFRWSRQLEEIVEHTQLYRLVYRGRMFNITDYDDYMERHRTVKVEGILYGA